MFFASLRQWHRLFSSDHYFKRWGRSCSFPLWVISRYPVGIGHIPENWGIATEQQLRLFLFVPRSLRQSVHTEISFLQPALHCQPHWLIQQGHYVKTFPPPVKLWIFVYLMKNKIIFYCTSVYLHDVFVCVYVHKCVNVYMCEHAIARRGQRTTLCSQFSPLLPFPPL